MVSQRSLRLSSFPFILFPLFYFGQWFPPFWLPGHLFVLLPPFFCYWFLLVYFSSQSICSFVLLDLFVNISSIFSILFSQILDHLHYHYSEYVFWRLPIFTLLSCFYGILSYSFIWEIIVYLFILTHFVWLCFSFWRLQDCGSSCFFCVPSGVWGWEVGVGFLMGGTDGGKNWVLIWWAGLGSVKP